MALYDRVIARTLPFVPRAIVRKIASRYIAGETLDDALRVAAGLNTRGMRATLDILGEDIHTLDQAKRSVDGYLDAFAASDSRKLNANISVKLTALGLKVNPAACLELTERLVRRAGDLNNFVRIDMEDSSCTTGTLQIYRSLRKDHSNVGVVLQAYLRRTMNDV